MGKTPARGTLLLFLAAVLPACGTNGSGGAGGGTAGSGLPSVSQITPSELSLGDTITVIGSGFGAVQGSGTLKISGVAAGVLTWSDNQIQATVSAGSRTGAVVVEQPAGTGAPGFVVVLWSSKNPANVAVAVAFDNQSYPQIVSDGEGGAIIVWDDFRNSERDIYAQRVDGVGTPLWTANGIAVCSVAGHQQLPKVVSDGVGGAIIVWSDYRTSPTGEDFYAQRIDGSGALLWTSTGVNVCDAPGSPDTDPVLCSDGAGGAILTWTALGSGGIDVLAQRVSGGGATLWGSAGVPVCSASGIQYSPRVIPDGTGGAIVAWDDGRGANDDIYAQRLDAAGVPQWTADGVPICTAAQVQLLPKLVPDGSGGAIIVWQDYRVDGTNSDLYAQRVNAAGVVQWAANGVSVSSAAVFQGTAALIPDGAGGVIVSWEDTRDGPSHIYIQRLDGSGTALWTTDGVALTAGPSFQNTVCLAPSGTGGAIVGWLDFNSPFGLYAQRVDGAGAPQWAGLVPVSTPFANRYNPVAVSDGNGGAIFAWSDTRNSAGDDVYAQGISPGGH